MPKIINHEKKKEQIIQYAFDSIVENGVKGSTVRQIAKLAEMTPGQIRYYFPNHSELLNAVMSTVELKVRRRIEVIFTSENLNTIDKAKASLLSVLPLDQERLADMEVWMAFRYDIHEYGQSTLDDGIDQLCTQKIKQAHKCLPSIINPIPYQKLVNPNKQARWFGLFPFRSPLLRESIFLSLPAGT
ncbi:TetR/AcrR family transcriptional regulator, partial [Staphylococcus cohnii]